MKKDTISQEIRGMVKPAKLIRKMETSVPPSEEMQKLLKVDRHRLTAKQGNQKKMVGENNASSI